MHFYIFVFFCFTDKNYGFDSSSHMRLVDVLLVVSIPVQVLTVLSGVAQSAYKMCGDVRLLANLKEVEEPFAKTQARTRRRGSAR